MSIFQDFLYENQAIGGFTNKEFKTHFEYRVSEGNAPRQGDWGIQNGFEHEIAVCDGSVRFANVKKTVAYVLVGQDDFTGELIVEKWAIKHNWKRAEAA